ncbi:DinB family protein [Streptomyces huiliensis]|uniref:DinB family protein n=1 Tax=Streptomyces huiliensis TaxID=2876027 RepID=UPI001CC050D1|nr:DinB family protein [Streptomyces huiliensis]MBZ4320975.1 DinB family protein [Streptomyces huiliensis]
MTEPERRKPPHIADEPTALEAFLEFQRATLEQKCAGLDEAGLRTASVPPSTMTLLGLVRHLADVERHWYRRVFAGEDAPPRFYDDENLEGDFEFPAEATWEEALAAWREEVAAARAAVRGRSLEELSAAGHHKTGQPVGLRWIHLHMIEEYARHNGHADLIRERVDGATGV